VLLLKEQNFPPIFSLMMTVFIYPISGHWVWQGDGWLTKLGFIDLLVQLLYTSVGGWASLVLL
jgi:Amt family ammonium transporter